jgi:hypothetical protein
MARVIKHLSQSNCELGNVEPPSPHQRAEYQCFSEILRVAQLAQLAQLVT